MRDENYCFPSSDRTVSVTSWSAPSCPCQKFLLLSDVMNRCWWALSGGDRKQQEGEQTEWQRSLLPLCSYSLSCTGTGAQWPWSLNQRETKAVKRRRSTSILVQRCTALAWGWNSGGKRTSYPVLWWSATELVQTLCETSLKPVKLNFVVSILLVEHFPSWNVAHQQYLRSLVHAVPHDLWGYCPCCGWMDCMPHWGMLSLQTDSCVYKVLQDIQPSGVYYSCAEPSPERPGLAYREPTADHTPRYAQSWKQLSGLTVALFLSFLFSPISWFGLFLLFPLWS